MFVYRISPCTYIEDLSGKGASLFGGRWNTAGVSILYTASSASLALLETIVHMIKVPKEDFCLVKLRLPETSFYELTAVDLPRNWSDFPASTSLQSIGDQFIAEGKKLALMLPSAVMPAETIILLNPKHPEWKFVQKEFVQKIYLDSRLLTARKST